MLVAIASGAWALFNAHDQLVACGLGDPRLCDRHRIADIRRVVIERPRFGSSSADDVIARALSAGEWGGVYRHSGGIAIDYAEVGSDPKNVRHARIWATLSGLE